MRTFAAQRCSDFLECLELPIVTRGLKIAGIFFVAIILTGFLRRAVKRVEEKVNRESGELRAAQRTQTMTKVLTSAGIVAIWLLATLSIMGTLGFDLGPLIAGLGIGGLAIGFGAQSLVRDVVTGFFILSEDQYGIGDLVQVNQGPTGKVEQLTLRVTGLRDIDGTLHYISNGNITQVANRSKDWSGAIVDVSVPADQELDHVRGLLDRVSAEAKEDRELGRALLGAPQVLGVENLKDGQVTLRLLLETRPGRQQEATRALKQKIKSAFDAESISVTTS